MIGAIGTVVVAGGVIIGLILGRTPPKADLSTIHTEASTEAPAENKPQETKAPETEPSKAPEESVTAISAKVMTYTSGKVSIEYPAIEQMEDEEKQSRINEHLKANALSILDAYEINESADTLSVSCEIISADPKRLTAVYTGELSIEGGAHPSRIFYTNTLNLNQMKDMGLNDFTDAYTMAGYVLSDDVKFNGISADVEAAVLEYRSSLDIDTLTRIFDGADFPLASETQWPESFSYEKQGTIYFSMPVPHALGDYVIVAFDPSTK